MIEEKIRQWCAAATVEEAGERVVVVPDRDVAEVCRRLHDDAEEPMDFMRDLVAAGGGGRPGGRPVAGMTTTPRSDASDSTFCV